MIIEMIYLGEHSMPIGQLQENSCHYQEPAWYASHQTGCWLHQGSQDDALNLHNTERSQSGLDNLLLKNSMLYLLTLSFPRYNDILYTIAAFIRPIQLNFP